MIPASFTCQSNLRGKTNIWITISHLQGKRQGLKCSYIPAWTSGSQYVACVDSKTVRCLSLSALCTACFYSASWKIWSHFDVECSLSPCFFFSQLFVEYGVHNYIFKITHWGWTGTQSEHFSFILLEETGSKNRDFSLHPLDCVHVDGIITLWCCEEEEDEEEGVCVCMLSFLCVCVCCNVSVSAQVE